VISNLNDMRYQFDVYGIVVQGVYKVFLRYKEVFIIALDLTTLFRVYNRGVEKNYAFIIKKKVY